MTAFSELCNEIVTTPPLPFHFSSRVKITKIEETTMKLSVNRYPFENAISLEVVPLDSDNFPVGGVHFVNCEDFTFMTKLYFSKLMDDNTPLKELLEKLSDFLEHDKDPELSVIPVADRKTRIVAILGPDNLNDDANEWIAADFALLYHALGGVAASEHWFTSINLHKHVEEKGELLHGLRTRPRRSVLNKNTPQFYQLVLDTFVEFDRCLRKTVADAAGDECIIVIICAHGIAGNLGSPGSVLLGKSIFTQTKLQTTLASSKVPTTAIFTPCFSGMWTIPYRSTSRPHRTEAPVTIFAATSEDLPSFSFPASPSNRLRGGPFTSALVSTLENLVDPIDTSNPPSRTLPSKCRKGILQKFIDFRSVQFQTTARAASVDFSAFADSVAQALEKAVHPPPSLHLTPQDKGASVATILGYEEEVALLYRLSALRELPERARYEAIPLGIEQVPPRLAVGGCVTLQDEAKLKAKIYLTQYHQPFNYDLALHPQDMSLAMQLRKFQSNLLNSNEITNLISMLNVRIDLDEQANRLAIYLVANSANGAHEHHSEYPSIWNYTTHRVDFKTLGKLIGYFHALQERFSPGWEKILKPGSGGYGRPAYFLSRVAFDLGFKTVTDVQPVVSGFFEPVASISLPSMRSVDDCLEIVTSSLSMTALS